MTKNSRTNPHERRKTKTNRITHNKQNKRISTNKHHTTRPF